MAVGALAAGALALRGDSPEGRAGLPLDFRRELRRRHARDRDGQPRHLSRRSRRARRLDRPRRHTARRRIAVGQARIRGPGRTRSPRTSVASRTRFLGTSTSTRSSCWPSAGRPTWRSPRCSPTGPRPSGCPLRSAWSPSPACAGPSPAGRRRTPPARRCPLPRPSALPFNSPRGPARSMRFGCRHEPVACKLSSPARRLGR